MTFDTLNQVIHHLDKVEDEDKAKLKKHLTTFALFAFGQVRKNKVFLRGGLGLSLLGVVGISAGLYYLHQTKKAGLDRD